MTREEKIKEAAYSHFCNDSAVTFNLQCHCFQKGAEWADQNPRKGLWDAEKVITWIALHAELYGGFNQSKLNSMCEDLRKAMEG